MNIICVSSEVVPYSKTGGLADVAGALPRDVAALGHTVSVMTPYYRSTKKFEPRAKVVAEGSVPVGSEKIAWTRVKDLWPSAAGLQPPQRWVWHIVPQGSEKKYRDKGRVHVVEAWTRAPL